MLAASIHPHTQWSSAVLIRQTLALLCTVVGSPVYEWRLFPGEEYNRGKFTDKLTFLRFVSGALKVLLLNSGLTLGVTPVWSLVRKRVQMNLAYISSFSPVSFFFLSGALLCLCTALSTCCRNRYSHKVEALCSFIQRTTVMLHTRLYDNKAISQRRNVWANTIMRKMHKVSKNSL